MNKKLFDGLTPELQAAVQSSMSQALEKYNAVAKKEEMMYLKKLEDYGIKTTRLTPEQRKPWVEHGRSIWPKMKDECGEEIVEYVTSKVK